MSWDHQDKSLSDFDEIIKAIDIKISANAPVNGQLAFMRAFLADRKVLPETELLAK